MARSFDLYVDQLSGREFAELFGDNLPDDDGDAPDSDIPDDDGDDGDDGDDVTDSDLNDDDSDIPF